MVLPGERIKARRKELGLTQVELARLLGINQSSLSELENGESQMPKSDNLMKLAKVPRVSQAWIMTGKDGDLEVLDAEEERHITALRGLGVEERKAIYSLVETLKSGKD
jgi:transcriptional regulator with XRE-family HTH domain